MLNLSLISDIGLDSRDNSVEAMTRISDVIRSLSDVVVSQNESYIQSYISLQTFDNNGAESTSNERRHNASSIIQQKYRDISLESVVRDCTGVPFPVPDSMITINVDGNIYDFGFNGEKIICQPSYGQCDPLYYAHGGLLCARPNMNIYDASNVLTRQAYTVGTKYSEFSLLPDGTINETDKYVWLWISSISYSTSSGWFIPVNVLIKKLGPRTTRAEIYTVPNTYTSESDYGLCLMQTLKTLPNVAKNAIYAEPSNPMGLSFSQYVDSDYIDSNYLRITWENDTKGLIPLPHHSDCILNSELGKRLIKFKYLPGNIVDWIRANS